MYSYLRPKIVIPVHGEAKHIREHVNFALASKIPNAVGVANGDVVRIAPGKLSKVARVSSGRLILAGRDLLPIAGRKEEKKTLKTNL